MKFIFKKEDTMKIRNSLLFLVVLTVPFLLLSASAGAALINGGFEDDFTGWTAAGNTSVQTLANVAKFRAPDLS